MTGHSNTATRKKKKKKLQANIEILLLPGEEPCVNLLEELEEGEQK